MKYYDKNIDMGEKAILTAMLILVTFEIGFFTGYFCRNRYDVNEDGRVTSADYVLIKNYIMREDK